MSFAALWVLITKTGFKAVRLEATDYATRAWPGGCGDKKLGANYAPASCHNCKLLQGVTNKIYGYLVQITTLLKSAP